MRYHDDLEARFEQLNSSQISAQARGIEFERLVADLFKRDDFDVTANAKSARPRQTDLYAERGSERYLIEVKWRKQAIGTPEVAELRDRLERQAPGLIGVLVSAGPIAETAITEVEQHRRSPVLLLDRGDVEGMVRYDRSLRMLLQDKEQRLLVDGKATGTRADTVPPRSTVSGQQLTIRVTDSSREWLANVGDYRGLVSTLELADIDWVPSSGHGVALDFQVGGAFSDLGPVLAQLADLGWLAESAAWTLEQASRNWSGFGQVALDAALAGRLKRYRGLDAIHHTERLILYDECPGGWYTLKADLDSQSGEAFSVDLSIRLSGIPLDTRSLTQLTSRLRVRPTPSFRPLAEDSVKRLVLRRPIPVDPLATITVRDRKGVWTCGIAIKNPLSQTEIEDFDLVRAFEDPELILLARLLSWHKAKTPVGGYFLERVEWARSADATVVSATVDWSDA